MSYVSTSTPGAGNTAGSNSFTWTVPAGVTTLNTLLFQVSGASNTADETVGVTVTRAGGGGTFATVASVGTGSNNHWATYVKASGVAAGDVLTFTLSGSRLVWMYPHIFDADIPTIGTFGGRAGTSGATVVAPSMTVAAGQKVLVLATARDTGASSTPTYVNSNGNVVATKFFADETTGAQCSYYVGEMTAAGTATGTTTLTYSLSSGNASALHAAETTVAAAAPNFFPALG